MSIIGKRSKATSSTYENPTEYEFQYEVVDLDALIPSNTDTLQPNPLYPQELQPRDRDRSASKVQIDKIARTLNPKGLLYDTGHIDTGIMIVGGDNVVESGNGRVLALRKARAEYPKEYAKYKGELKEYAKMYGLDEGSVSSMTNPVLVRKRITPVDRVEFTAAANAPATMSMSTHEQAMQDAGRISDSILATLDTGDEQSIDQALRSSRNRHIVNHFTQKIPANERASISDADGNLSISGLNRLKAALFSKVYKGKAGERLSRTFSESLEPSIKNVENAMFQSLPAMAKAQGLVSSGQRESNLLPTDDLADAIEKYAELKAGGMSVGNYMAQGKMFGDDMTDSQKQILTHIDTIGRSPKMVREYLNTIAEGVEKAPAKGQLSMLGDEMKSNKETIINDATNIQRKEKGLAPIPNTAITTPVQGLEEPISRVPEITRGMGEGIPTGLPEPERTIHNTGRREREATERTEPIEHMPSFVSEPTKEVEIPIVKEDVIPQESKVVKEKEPIIEIPKEKETKYEQSTIKPIDIYQSPPPIPTVIKERVEQSKPERSYVNENTASFKSSSFGGSGWNPSEKELKDILGKGKGDFTVEGGDVLKDAEKVVHDKAIEDEQSEMPGYTPKGEKTWEKEWRKELERKKVAENPLYKKERRERARGKVYGEFANEKEAKKKIKELQKASPEHRFKVYTEMTDTGGTKVVIGERGMTNDERKAESAKRRATRKAAKARREWFKKQGKSITRASENIARALQPGTVPRYIAPNMDFGKSGYTPLKYKPVEGVKQYRGVSGEPYYRKGHGYKVISDEPYYKPINMQSSGGVMSQANEGSGVMSQGKPYIPIFSNPRPVPFVNTQSVKKITRKTKRYANPRIVSS
jgi:hypothetical protein